MSNFGYKDAKGQIVQIPVRYGDMTRQVASILRKNSENSLPSAPFIACYIKDLQFDRPRLQDPTYVSKLQIRERAYDKDGNQYLNYQGTGYTVERIMPTPYEVTFSADIWTTNLDQKLQLWEQLAVLFTPSLELQTTDNYIDWTSITVLNLASQMWSSRAIPQGVDDNIDVLTMNFTSPIWITPPAKVKKLGIITKIISNLSVLPTETIETDYRDPNGVYIFGGNEKKIVVTPGDFDLLVMHNIAYLIKNNLSADTDIAIPQNVSSWRNLLDLYPGEFKAGLTQIRLTKPDKNEIIAYVSLDPTDETKMMLNIDGDTIPTNTIIDGRGTIDAIINPETFAPNATVAGTRYLILENININSSFSELGYDGPDAWKNLDGSDFQAHGNDIIEWNGNSWNIIFDSTTASDVIYITNSYTGVQYKWENGAWSKSFEGIYSKELWRLVL